jgi:hypothetical protein
MRPMTGPDQAVARPALPLRPFVSHYAGSRMKDVPPCEHISRAAGRVFRFERACRLFLRSPHRIADVATASGFHDQAHMVREWHALAGCTPRQRILGELPFLQDYEIGGGHD